MAFLFYVHGTGVRKAGLDATMSGIKEGLDKVGRTDLELRSVPWGDLLGTRVTQDHITEMLPAAAAKGIGGPDPEIEATLWANLMTDPLFELRILALKQATGPVIVQPGAAIPSEALKTNIRTIPSRLTTPSGGVSIETIRQAADWLADSPEAAPVLTQAANAVQSSTDPTLISVTARALVARALVNSRGQVGEGPDALYRTDQRAALVAEVESTLTGGVKGIADWFRNVAVDFAKAKLTEFGKDRRSGVMTAASPGVGDILLSQRRGEGILELIHTEIEKLQGDVYVMGHSLGGIFLVNLLSRKTRPANVRKLITVGSQSPFFFACDAMETLRLNNPPSTLFTPWLNVFDRNDFLSFCASQTFNTVQNITDFEVQSGVPFPDSHGAYFRLDSFYQRLSLFLT